MDNDRGLGSTTVAAQLSGYVEIADKRFPLSGINATFGINSIPSAQITIPIGRLVNSENDDEVVRIRDVTDKMRQYSKAKVWLKIAGDFAPGVPWPTAAFEVFSGYVTGTSSMRTTTGMALVINLTHWLLDLDASSAISDFLVPGSPVGVQLPTTSDYTSVTSALSDRAMEDIDTDIWAGGIKSKLIQLCNETRLDSVVECLRDVAGDVGTLLSNDKALVRLNGSDDAFDIEKKIDVVPLQLDNQDSTADNLMWAIRVSIMLSMSDASSLVGASMWSKILSLAGLYGFTVVPTVNSATCAPVSYTLAGDDPSRHTTIFANEYHAIKPSDGLFRVWRGMIVTGEFATSYNSVQAEPGSTTAFIGALGCYFPERDEDLDQTVRDAAAAGVIQFAPAPNWVQPEFRSILEAAARVERELQQQNHTMAGPPDSLANNAAEAEQSRVDDITLNSKTIGTEFAKWLYWVNQFRGISAQLTGKLRFDIAPGSIVRIEDLDGKLYESDSESSWLYAAVTAVAFSIDTESATASTSFSLSHVRRHSERHYGLDRHPLYAQPWLGTVLQNLEFNSANGVTVAQVGTHET